MNPEPNNGNDMKEYQYHLERYKGQGSRHECPRCHDKRSFAYYVDDIGNIIDKSVGRCNHESGCGYHYTPKEWFRNNPDTTKSNQPQRVSNNRAGVGFNRVQFDTPPREPDSIDPKYLLQSISYDSSLAYYLCGLLPNDTIKRVWDDYGIGATKDHSVIFWQIDASGKVRTGKVMKYDPETGHRIKNGTGVNWVHSLMKRRGLLPESFNLVQCLFGEHLLRLHPDKGVALVESEKTALIGSCVFPQFVWLATGGKSQLAPNKMKVLKGRRVVAFPDIDGVQEWKSKATELSRFGIDIAVSDIIERNATPDERQRKIDIADWMLAQLESTSATRTTLERLIQKNPCIGILIDKLELVIA